MVLFIQRKLWQDSSNWHSVALAFKNVSTSAAGCRVLCSVAANQRWGALAEIDTCTQVWADIAQAWIHRTGRSIRVYWLLRCNELTLCWMNFPPWRPFLVRRLPKLDVVLSLILCSGGNLIWQRAQLSCKSWSYSITSLWTRSTWKGEEEKRVALQR